MKKRIVALVSALTLVFAMSINVAAATESITANDVKDIAAEVGASDVALPGTSLNDQAAALNVDGIMTGATAQTVTNETVVKALVSDAAAVLAADDVESVEVTAVVDLKVTGDTVTIKMSVGANQKVYALHYDGATVDKRILGTVNADGTVTFKSDSWSPVAIIKVTEKAATTVNQPPYNPAWDPTVTNASAPAANAVAALVAPKTGDVVMMVSIMAIIFMAGAAVAVAMSKKRA